MSKKVSRLMKPQTGLSNTFTFIEKGEIVDYQAMIEERIGMFISGLKIYDSNLDMSRTMTDIYGDEKEIDRDRAYFNADADYEIIIRKKKTKNDE